MSWRACLTVLAPVLLACEPTGTVHDVTVALYTDPRPTTLVVRAGDQVRVTVAPDGGVLTLTSVDPNFRDAFPHRFDAQGAAGRTMFASSRLGPGDTLRIPTRGVPPGTYAFFVWDGSVPTGRLALTVQEDPIGGLVAALDELVRLPLRLLPSGEPEPAAEDVTRFVVEDSVAADATSDWMSHPVEDDLPQDSGAIMTFEGDPSMASDPSDETYFDFQVEKPVAVIPGPGAPRYPEILLSAGVEGQVLAQYVVDTLGRADPETFKVIRSDHELFTAAVRSALPAMRFLPAEVGGRKVKQLVQQPFVFNRQR